MTYLAVALAAFVSGFLSQTYGFITLFSVMISAQFLGVAGSIYLYFFHNETPTETPR